MGEGPFRGRKAAERRGDLGPAVFATHQAGEPGLEDVVRLRRDPKWRPVGYERSLKDILGEREARKWRGLSLADNRAPKPLSAAASDRYLRMRQVSAMSSQDIDSLLTQIRQSRTIPKLSYHFEQHGAEFGARDEQEYLQRMQEHLSREGLRIFTYLRGRQQMPFWELIDLENGATVLYNESRRSVWSFYRMALPEYRLRRYQQEWLEAVRTPRGWEFKESWDL